MLWPRSKYFVCMWMMTGVLISLSGCSSNNKEPEMQRFCLSSGQDANFDCNAEPDNRIDWTDSGQFRFMLKGITAPVLTPGVTAETKGFTLQLAAFRTQERLSNFLNSSRLKQSDSHPLYLMKRSDGWFSVCYGFFPGYSEALNVDAALRDRGLKTWLRPVRFGVLRGM